MAASWLRVRPACWPAGRRTVAGEGEGRGGGHNNQGEGGSLKKALKNPADIESFIFFIPSFRLHPPRLLLRPLPTTFHKVGREPPSKVLTVFQRQDPERDSSLKKKKKRTKNHTAMAFFQEYLEPLFSSHHGEKVCPTGCECVGRDFSAHWIHTAS